MIVGFHRINRSRELRRSGGASARPGERGAESGETLIELLMTVVLLGLAIVAIITTLTTLVVASNSHRRRVRSANEATTVVESLQRAAYVNCAGTGSYGAALDSALRLGPGAGTADPQSHNYDITITRVRYLANKAAPTPSFGAACGTDQGVQEITLKVESPHQNFVSEEIVFMKRSPCDDVGVSC